MSKLTQLEMVYEVMADELPHAIYDIEKEIRRRFKKTVMQTTISARTRQIRNDATVKRRLREKYGREIDTVFNSKIDGNWYCRLIFVQETRAEQMELVG